MIDARGNIRLLMTPGPVEVSPSVLAALASPSIHHYYPRFIEFFEETVEKLRQVFQTKNDIVIMQAEGILGLEAAVANVMNPGEKVLVLDSGPFGKWFGEYVVNYGGEIVELRVEYDDAIEPADVKRKLEEEKDIKALTVVHCETPAGIVNPIREICKIGKEHGVITIVDAVASLGGIDVRPDEWGIDPCITGSQKCLSSTPGLTIISVSEEAWEVMEKRKKPIRNSYLSLLDWREAWIRNKRFPHTPLVAEIYGINQAATEILEEGLQNVFDRHAKVAKATRNGIEGMGLKLWPKKKEIASNTVTTFKLPEEVDDVEFIQRMADKYGVLIGGGFRELKGKLVRIGHMGYNATLPNIVATLVAIEKTLTDMGHPVKFGSSINAALPSL